jgi:hypothetical protein
MAKRKRKRRSRKQHWTVVDERGRVITQGHIGKRPAIHGALGGSAIVHVRELRRALQAQGRDAARAIEFANQGRCGAAFSAYEDATYRRGEAVAHQSQIKHASGRERVMPRGTLVPLRKLNEARRVVERRCVVKG